jgi:hypothetical protein
MEYAEFAKKKGWAIFETAEEVIDILKRA